MQAMRTIGVVDDDGLLKLQIPRSFGKRVEVIILPVEENHEFLSWELLKAQESMGFVKEVLGNPAEDVWNDL